MLCPSFSYGRADTEIKQPLPGSVGVRMVPGQGLGLLMGVEVPTAHSPQLAMRLAMQRGSCAPGVNVNGAELLGEVIKFSVETSEERKGRGGGGGGGGQLRRLILLMKIKNGHLQTQTRSSRLIPGAFGNPKPPRGRPGAAPGDAAQGLKVPQLGTPGWDPPAPHLPAPLRPLFPARIWVLSPAASLLPPPPLRPLSSPLLAAKSAGFPL